ncbi:hypothetical protein H2200_012689 [Cladophialophora chaetospira]|uniref:DUF6594 domain-containing protein n=1 Tax=Cladophialophora chaetospira TaxID=386627 RepID=A0AA38WXF3_9EURO|nr:hypothetical protein H2200_012689 [Cladophialophora chaetospira]
MDGYNGLSEQLGAHPALMILRRFLPLNARNILVMQGELLRLDDSLKVTIEDDSKSGNSKRTQYPYNIGLLKGPHSEPDDGVQWKKTKAMRKLLKNYSYEAILQVAALSQLAPVDKGDLACLRELLEKPCGSGKPFPQSLDYFTYAEENESDLTSLTGVHKNKDMLTRWLDRWVRTVFHKYVGQKYHDPISTAESGGSHVEPLRVHSYSDHAITSTIDTLSTILASILPTVAALGIYLIKDQMTRMGAIVACTLLFSTIFTLIARPKRAECFAASAAFAAVLVVFVGNSNGNLC